MVHVGRGLLRALAVLTAIGILRNIRQFVGFASGSYHGYLEWTERRGHWEPGFEAQFLLLALAPMLRPGFIWFEVGDAILCYTFQIWLEQRYPSRRAPKDHELEHARVGYAWTNILTKWVLENVAFTAAKGLLLGGLTRDKPATESLLYYAQHNSYLAIRHNFLQTKNPVLSFFSYVLLPAGYREPAKEAVYMVLWIFFAFMDRVTMPDLPVGMDPKILEAIRQHQISNGLEDIGPPVVLQANL